MLSSCMGSLMELAAEDSNVLYLTADSGEGGLELMFRRNFPERSFNFGIAEENMVAAAAGLAASGKIPFVYTAAPFLAYRSYEFIRNDICLQNLPVKLVGTGSGISVSSLGPTHHTTEDISVLRSLPGLKILSPAVPKQAYECIKAAYGHNGPVYIRLALNRERRDFTGKELSMGRGDAPGKGYFPEDEYFPDDYRMPGDKAEVLRQGKEVSVFTTGSILPEVLDAADRLEGEGISAGVINVPTLKPFDAETVAAQAKKTGLFCVVEEHNVIGGLGSMVSDALIDMGVTAKVVKIGLNDCFSAGYGKLGQVRKENGLDADTITRKIKEACG